MRLIVLFLMVGLFLLPRIFADDGDYSMAMGQINSNIYSNYFKTLGLVFQNDN